MPLRIETGHPITKDVHVVPGKTVRFVAGDGRTMFEVSAMKDGKSLEVRAVENVRVEGVLFSTSLNVKPRFENCVLVTVDEYETRNVERMS